MYNTFCGVIRCAYRSDCIPDTGHASEIRKKNKYETKKSVKQIRL